MAIKFAYTTSTTILNRLHSPPFLHHPWPSAFSLPFPSLTSDPPRLFTKKRSNSSGSINSEMWLRSAKKRRQRKWFDDVEPDEIAPTVWEEFVDSMWFLKVLGSYGWMMPLIILSGLLASGPKPFIMAFSIPLGLSVLTYVFKKLLGWTYSSKKFKRKGTKVSHEVNMENAMMEVDEPEIQQKSNQRRQYQSYTEEPGESGSMSDNGALSFGGWGDLIGGRELRRRMGQTGTPLEKRTRELLRRAEGERDLPLVLRLLVAVFPPFLNSWADLL